MRYIMLCLRMHVKPRLHVHGFPYNSTRLTPISHGKKNRDGSGKTVAKS